MVRLRSAVSLIKQLPIWKGLPYPLSTRGCVKWIQLLWFPSHRHLSGWKHFFIIAFNSMLGVPTVPLLRLKLSWRSFSTFVIAAFCSFRGGINDPTLRTQENTKHIKLYPCYFQYITHLKHSAFNWLCVWYEIPLCFGIFLWLMNQMAWEMDLS